jgi:predicted metal-dependent peptidase
MRSGIEKLNVATATHKEILNKGRDSVSDALAYLTSAQVQNFYARVVSGIDRCAVPGLGTMAVTVRKGKYIMMYDPVFAATVSHEELCATVEHEVMHIILHHIPRLMTLMARSTDEDKYLHKIVANLAMDAAANELLVASWPRMRDADKPLGYWVFPEGFTPKLPPKQSFDVYQTLLYQTLNKRLKTSPKELYQMAAAMLKGVRDKARQALQQNSETPPESSESGSDPKENSEGQASPGSNAEPNPYEQLTDPQLQQQANNLDPVDAEILKMLLSAMQSHMLIEEAAAQADEGESHQLENHGRELIRNAAKSHKKSRGTLPGNLEELIRKMLLPPTVSWTDFLHNIVQKTRQTKKSRGMSRPSKSLSALKKYAQIKLQDGNEESSFHKRLATLKRVPPFPGTKQSRKYTIVYVVDTSGSMSDAELEKGLSELQHLQKADSDIDICVIYADTAVCKEYWVTPSSEIDRNMTGRGGTDFELVFQHVQRMGGNSDKAPDILIYCTDGYAPPPSTRLPITTVWLLTPNGQPVMRDAGHITLQMRDYQLGESL